jgi:hypothetical protein
VAIGELRKMELAKKRPGPINWGDRTGEARSERLPGKTSTARDRFTSARFIRPCLVRRGTPPVGPGAAPCAGLLFSLVLAVPMSATLICEDNARPSRAAVPSPISAAWRLGR